MKQSILEGALSAGESVALEFGISLPFVVNMRK